MTTFRDTRFAYDSSSNVEYIGQHPMENVDENDEGWLITKFTYSGSDPTRSQGPIKGAWGNRKNLDWG